MPLDWNASQQTADERAAEALRILQILDRERIDECIMSEREANFVEDMRPIDGKIDCSPAQLKWLRAIKDKYL